MYTFEKLYFYTKAYINNYPFPKIKQKITLKNNQKSVLLPISYFYGVICTLASKVHVKTDFGILYIVLKIGFFF